MCSLLYSTGQGTPMQNAFGIKENMEVTIAKEDSE